MLQTKLSDETGRLASLRRYDVLDTPAEAPFDKITQLVKTVLDVPIAAVSLVDADRQWFKSCVGLDVRETSRDISFCTHTIQTRLPMIIGDALRDPKFANNPLVLGPPHIRSYAGAPLITPDGYAIGSLCAIDTVPRDFEPWQIDVLSSFAALVVDEFELRRLAQTDSQTGALSRRAFVIEAERAIAQFSRNGIKSSILSFDIDSFKDINDKFGYATGDEILRAFAAHLTALGRPGDLLARLGGDEFAFLLTETTLDQAIQTAEYCRNALGELAFDHDPKLRLTASFGIADIAPGRTTADLWLTDANLALQNAKQAGGNICRVFAAPAAEAEEEILLQHYEDDDAALEDEAVQDDMADADLEAHKASMEPLSYRLWCRIKRLPQIRKAKAGRLAFGGLHPGLVTCHIAGLTDSGMRVETFAQISPMPEFFSVEFCEIYCRARTIKSDGFKIELEFIFDRA